MKLRVDVYIKGGMGRPSYDGRVNVYVGNLYNLEMVKKAVFNKLRATSFPEINLSDVQVRRWEEQS